MSLIEKVQRSIFLCPLPVEVEGQVQKNILHSKHYCRRSQARCAALYFTHTQHVKVNNEKR